MYTKNNTFLVSKDLHNHNIIVSTKHYAELKLVHNSTQHYWLVKYKSLTDEMPGDSINTRCKLINHTSEQR